MQCFPLQSVILALENPTIDYLTLDIEENQLDILKTVNLTETNITIIGAQLNKTEGEEEKNNQNITNYLTTCGYKKFKYVDGFVSNSETVQIDEFFVKNE